MSRRKVRGLTRTGRQVSEDPDLDNLLSNLSPEEMEELQKEVSTVPDPDPSEMIIVDQTDLKHTILNKRDSLLTKHGELKTVLQRNLSIEGEPKRESRKQEYLRKMGLSQEADGVSKGSREEEGQICVSNAPVNEENNYVKNQNKGSSKTKNLITKLQEKKVDCKEKDGRGESWKRESGDSKTRETIRRLQEKRLKEEKSEQEIITEIRKQQDSKTKCIGFEDDKKLIVDHKQAESSNKQKKEQQVEEGQIGSNDKTNDDILKEDRKRIDTVEKKTETENINEVKKEFKISSYDIEKKSAQNENPSPEFNVEEKIGDNNANITLKKEEAEEESCSIFDEDLERLQKNDPMMTDVNVNNSEVINVKTLIQFAKALHNNVHVKTFALANCRADDHVAYAIASMLRSNKSITGINMDSNLLTSKGIMALVQALQYNTSITELRFHNQRHICGGKTEMEMTKLLKENTTLLKLGYQFELAGPRMTMTNILSRNMDRQRQKRLREQKQATAQETEDKKDSLKVQQSGIKKGSPKNSLKSSPARVPSPKSFDGPGGPPPPPPPPGGVPPPLILDSKFLKNNLTPMSQRKLDDKTGGRGGGPNSRDQLLASIRDTSSKQLKKVALPKLLQ